MRILHRRYVRYLSRRRSRQLRDRIFLGPSAADFGGGGLATKRQSEARAHNHMY